ncbi:MAG: LLM class oxidoreductase [Pseudomonadota bacterium]
MTFAQKLDLGQRFAQINLGYASVFSPGELSLGLVVPIESYPNGPVPTMTDHVKRVQLAETLGFSAVWLRDVPFNVPAFGDAGQTFDPFVYLGALAMQTQSIALGAASIVLPLRHPAHVAKAAATADVLSGGRLILGIASGDRPEEYPALGIPFADRDVRFREAYEYIRGVAERQPSLDSGYGRVSGGIDSLPKPVGGKLPLLITGSSRQSPEWVAANGDGWMTYPRPAAAQSNLIQAYRDGVLAVSEFDKPVMEPLYIDLVDDPTAAPQPIHLGLRLGTDALRTYLESRRDIGVNHIALNLRFCRGNIERTLEKLSVEILPYFKTRNS